MAVNQAPTFTVAPGFTSATASTYSTNASSMLLLQPDGRIVVGSTNASYDFGLVGFTADGRPDTSFGTTGRVGTDLAGQDIARAAALQADGKMVLVGYTDATGSWDFAVVRYNADGSLDTSFSTDGKLTADFSSGFDGASDVALHADGRIVVVGISGAPDFFAVVYNSDGTLDTTFSADGKVNTDFAGGSDDASAVVIQPDGRIVVGGNGVSSLQLARYNPDGSLDAAFDGDGKVITSTGGGREYLLDLVLQPDGKMLGLGSSEPTPGAVMNMFVVRYNADGALDPTFGSGGIAPVATGRAGVIALQADGRIVVANDFALVRFSADGSLEGQVTHPLLTGGRRFSSPASIVVQPDGRILVSGNDHGTMNVVRYNEDLTIDPGFGPTTSLTLNTSVRYTPGASPVVMDSNVRVYDADLGAGDYAGATLTLARNGGASSQDVFSSTGAVGALAEGGALTYAGIDVGVVSTNSGGQLTLTFNDKATQSVLDHVLQSLAYSSPSPSIPDDVRIDWTFSDGNSGAQGTGGALSVAGATHVLLNHAPTITSNGGATSAATSVGENGTAVTTVTATDPESGAALVYSIAGGADAARFSINVSTGALRFVAAPDFETPTDAGANNVYDVVVRAADNAGGADTQAIAVTITNVPGVTLTGDGLNNKLIGGGEDDTLSALGGDDALYGNGAPDQLIGGDGSDHLFGGAGADALNGGTGTDYARYDYAGASVLVDLTGARVNTGEAAGDSFVSIEGVTGSAFGDRIYGDGNANELRGDNGNDAIAAGAGGDTLQGGEGNDSLFGEDDADSLFGGAGNDTLRGGAGNDGLYGGAGADVLDGEAGFDYARYDDAAAAVTVDLSGGIANTGDAAGDTYIAIESILGSNFADLIIGNSGANHLQGGSGNDVLRGGGGADTLYGGAGIDRFDYNAIGEGLDSIRDFVTGSGGDSMDIKDVLVGYNPGTSDIDDFVDATGTTSATILVNADGVGNDFVAMAMLLNVANSASLVSDMLANGNLLVS